MSPKVHWRPFLGPDKAISADVETTINDNHIAYTVRLYNLHGEALGDLLVEKSTRHYVGKIIASLLRFRKI